MFIDIQLLTKFSAIKNFQLPLAGKLSSRLAEEKREGQMVMEYCLNILSVRDRADATCV